MKVKDLIEELKKLDQEKEIMTSSYDDILGYCDYYSPFIGEDTAYKYDYIQETKKGLKHRKGYSSKISNWIPDQYDEVSIYTIGN